MSPAIDQSRDQIKLSQLLVGDWFCRVGRVVGYGG